MANVKPRYLLLFLLVLVVVESRGSRCPSKCSCFEKRKKSKVDCRGQGLTEVFSSDEFPSDMQVLDLSKNNISVIRRGFLDRHPQLEKLFLHRNSIQTLEERAFIGLSNLNRLVLKQNKLVKLKARAFLGLPNLDTLDLGFNKIQSIDKSAFFGFQKLSKLVLNNNSFTTIENGTFDSLTSLKRIEIKNLPLTCDCRLNPFIKFLAKLLPLKVLSGSCFGTSTRFASLLKTNLCDAPPELSIFPETDQVVTVGDRFQMVCKIKDKQNSKLLWEKNEGPIEKDKNIVSGIIQPSKFHLVMFMKFASVTESVTGTYTCSSRRMGVKAKTIKISVVDASLQMCRLDMIKTDRGPLRWPVSFPGSTVDLDCPSLHQPAGVKVTRTCAQDGVWEEVIFGECPRATLAQNLTKLANSLKRDVSKDTAGVTSTLKSLTDPSNFESYREVSLAFNVVAGIIRRQMNVPFTPEVLDNMLAIFNNIMGVDEGILYDAQRYDRSPSRLGALLELISRRIVDQKLSRVFSNIVIGSVDLKNNVTFQGKTCHVYFRSKDVSQPVGVQCQRNNPNYKNILVSIHVPKTIFKNLNSAGLKRENLRVQFLVYKNAKLFPNIISNMTDAVIRDRNVTSSVLAIQMADIKELNLTEPFVMTFATEAGRSPLISHFDFSEKVVGRPWSPNNDCHVNKSSITMTTVDCARLVNKNLAVMSLGLGGSIVTYPIEVVVYIGAVFASLFILATLITFAAFRNLRFNRDDALMLMNACLALLVVVTTFAFGIDGEKNNVVCLMVGVFLHFFFLASLLWLGSYVVCVSRRLEPPKESEEAYNPVLRYYMVSWGVPAIICGITLAGDLKNYRTSKYCWLTESAGLGAFVGPACLLFIVNCVLLVRLHLLLARGSVEPRPSGENSEEERLQGGEPGVLEEAPEPGSQLAAEKSAITLHLVATWVVMSLIYVNFIVAYFLVKSRSVKLSWKLLSYVYALANIALGVSVFSFYCVVRSDVREAWLNVWKRARAKRITCAYPRRVRLWITQSLLRSNAQPQPNGQIFPNGENINLATGKVDSDRQSNITLPSSAALTNDVFVNGRPLSSARVSLLDDADLPPEEDVRAGSEVNEVDITEVATSEDGHGRSQGSIHSERRVVSKVPTENTPFPEENLSLPGNLFTEVHEETQTDVTDGVTSKSESSAPTAIEVPMPSPSIDNSTQAYAPTKVVSPAERPTSGSSLSEIVPPSRFPNFKRKHSSDSLNSRNESGSTGPRARKYPQLLPQAYLSSSSAISEVQPKDPDPKRQRSSESVNSRGVARNAGLAAGATQRAKNRYKDGREKPEPKAWHGRLGAKIAYVPVPHVSKIHRQPSHNETSV